MTTIHAHQTVGEIVAAAPNRSRLFEETGIDYCCGGGIPLEEACANKGLSPNALIAQLEAMEAQADNDPRFADAASMGLIELISHILDTHHAYLRRELPRLSGLVEKVAEVHGDQDPRLRDLVQVFSHFVGHLQSHMLKEERVLFPAIQTIAESDRMPQLSIGSVAFPIGGMEAEHAEAGDTLTRIRELTDDLTPPDWACNTYRAMLAGLEELELDMHQHIHKENNVLFPRAIEYERSLNS